MYIRFHLYIDESLEFILVTIQAGFWRLINLTLRSLLFHRFILWKKHGILLYTIHSHFASHNKYQPIYIIVHYIYINK